jgi:hypothetical protein
LVATESASDAAIDEGLEEAGSKAELNRLEEREILAEEIEKRIDAGSSLPKGQCSHPIVAP